MATFLPDELSPYFGSETLENYSPGQTPCLIPADELLTVHFLTRHTEFTSFAAFLQASGVSPDNLSDFENRSDNSWEAFIRRDTCFSGWSAMLRDARGEWAIRRLGIVIDA